MCTSIVYNGQKTLIGFNLDILDMEYRVNATHEHVFIEIYDTKEGWLPLFGVNHRGEFVAMPTCWPFDQRSNPSSSDQENIMMMDIELLLEKKTLSETKEIAKHVCSNQGVTFMAQISDKEGNALQVIPGQGIRYLEKPAYSILSNFSPFKGDSEKHPWMGKDRYDTAEKMLKEAGDSLDTNGLFTILSAVSQTVCPTVVSIIYDPSTSTVSWCENREYNSIQTIQLS